MSDVRALLLTDVVDSTRLSAALGDAAAARLWAAHDRVARDLLHVHRGREIDRADGFLLLFGSATDAARYAHAYHRAIATLDVPLAARAGLHVGPVHLHANSAADVALGAKPLEVEGIAKPFAARIMALAGGGRTLLSAAAAAALDLSDLAGLALHALGHYRLKGIDEPVELLELAPPEAACPPPGDTDKAYRVTRDGELWQPVRQVRHNLVPERDAFIGRGTELRTLAEALGGGARLLTVHGPGGTGKTRLARRYAVAWLGEWPGGAYFCDLSDVHSLEGIHAAVALALDVPLGRGDAGVQLGHAIAGRGRCLLILDNFEQVQPHAAATVGRWLDRATQASFVVTSRERLHLAGESVLPLEPLPLVTEAIDLFAARARAQQPDFAVDASNRDAVGEIVRLLDGLPLAVELAAARVRVLSPAQIVERLRDRFALLGGTRDGAARQSTLKAAIDWSWTLLAAWEQAALAQCSVFEGGFTLAAAEAVVALDAWPDAPPVLDVVHALVDKSLLRTWRPASVGSAVLAEPCFGMYLSIRDYAAQKLRASGRLEVDEAERRHGDHYASFGSDPALEGLATSDGIAMRRGLALALDNLVGACRRALRRGDAPTAASCFLAAWVVFEARGPIGLAASLAGEILALGDLLPGRAAKVAMARAEALSSLGAIGESGEARAGALAFARAVSDRALEAWTLGHVALAFMRQGRSDEAQNRFEEALALATTTGHRSTIAAITANHANLQLEQGRMREAETSYRRAIALHRELGNRAAEGIALGNLGTLHHELGRHDEARAAYDAALAIHREAGALGQEAVTLGNLGLLDRERGDAEAAARCNAAALRIYRETGNRRGEGVVLGQMGDLYASRGETDLAVDTFAEALAIDREVGNRRSEGTVLASLGETLAGRGEVAIGRRHLEDAVRLLREVRDPLEVAKALCGSGLAAVRAGDAVAARAALAEAEAIAAELGAQPGSEIGVRLAALRDALARTG